MKKPLDTFGRFIIENLFDQGIRKFQRLSNEEIKTPSLLTLQQNLRTFNKNEIEIIQELIIEIMTSSTHDFLFAIQEQTDLDENIQMNVENENVADLSDGLHGEIFTESGWVKKYSAFKDLYEVK
ncbi:hypothetical protein L3049_10045 [Labilibaculum sp. DW002]|uniref:Uncharacterized protein n=1 Tax=Paralabilibaculum antarcticum TaxID=2912572 RepID=A0ABT5VSW9_9BACT|nr:MULTISPECIES: hypothetical protein [unclassified Labilibaculum]MBI9056213.1 hypothetical protein [Labilibaculum sp.]MDE5418350.1 hypothetical protein [Labilibaculum sp. DW002]